MWAGEALGADRGMAVLALLNPKFPVENAGEILSASPSPAVSFLISTFGHEWSNLYRLTDIVDASGKKLAIRIYLTCGPCRPPRLSGGYPHFARGLSIKRFNSQIVHSASLRFRYRKLALSTREALEPILPRRLVIYPELEDNLTPAAFKAMVRQIRVAFKGTGAKIGRNSLHPTSGGIVERHTIQMSSLASMDSNDAISMDGVEWALPNEPFRRSVASFAYIRKFIREAKAKGIDVFLWRREWQGLLGGKRKHPSKRKYKILAAKAIKQLLKG